MLHTKKKFESALLLTVLIVAATVTVGCASNAHAGYAFSASVATPSPAAGVYVSAPPAGYRIVKVGTTRYYYHGGTFYQRSGSRYLVVGAPVSARVTTLPRAAKVVVVGGKPYWRYRGAHYRWERRSRVWLVVRP